MLDVLALPGWAVVEAHLDEKGFLIQCRFLNWPTACIKCGTSGMLYRHGPKRVYYLDSPFQGRAVRLLAHVQRYKCRACNQTFLQPISGVEPDRRMTTRCLHYILSQSDRESFLSISQHLGCNESTVRNVVKDSVRATHQR